jgi:repressor of nif and glnA expression
MVRKMTDPNVERKLVEIMRIISESDKPVGARLIADELHNRGYAIGERAVRYHLRILDERGFTQKHGYIGRTITERGKKELSDALISDRLGFIITRIEELIYRTDYDLNTGKGNVIVNVTYIDKDDFDNAIDVVRYAMSHGATISSKIAVFEEDSTEFDIYVPEGQIALATVCSITFDGLLLKSGIPVSPAYGGLMQIEEHEPEGFIDLISYNGTSIDPIKLFLRRKSTSVLQTLDTGSGKMLANVREIPAAAASRALEVMELAKKADIQGHICIGEPGEEVFYAPVSRGMVGIPVMAGINAVAAVEEAGINVETLPVSTVMEYRRMKQI